MRAFSPNVWIGVLLASSLNACGQVGAQGPLPAVPGAPVMAPTAMPAINQQFVGMPQGGVFQINPTSTGFSLIGPCNRTNRMPGFARMSRLQVRMNSNWPGAYGYRPVEFAFSAQQPASSDRKIRIHFHGGVWQADGRSVVVEQDLVLPAGASTTSTQILVPQYLDWNLCGWEIFVDGQLDEGLVVVVPNMRQAPVANNVAGLVTPPRSNSFQIQHALLGQAGGNVTLHAVRTTELPEAWLAYSTLDLVVMPAAELPRLAQSAPKKAAALLRWVRAGGNLWLVEAGDDFEKLDGAASAIEAAATSDKDFWRTVPTGERSHEPVEQALALSDFDISDLTTRAEDVKRAIQALHSQPQDSSKLFRIHPLGLGVVAAFPLRIEPPRSGNPSGRRRATITAIGNSLLSSRLSALNRYGNQPSTSNYEFNNLLIPDVGQAPVLQFQFLITLFALAIGPANYWWWRRRKKLPMLLVTTPLAALAVTSALLGYGVLADGMGVRVRARSLTMLDQRAGESACWARLSYYAGMAPQDGLAMPLDTAVYPILPDWVDDSSFGRRSVSAHRREMRWDDRQQLARGWAPSRTPTQFLTIAARSTKKRLDLRVGDHGLRVVNRLGVHVLQAAVQDHDGRLFYFEGLDDRAAINVQSTDRSNVAPKMRKAFSDNFLSFPAGAEDPRGSNNFGVWLSKNLSEARLEAINSPMVQDWGDGSYIAITDQGVELSFGLKNVSEEASFHVIEGKW